MNKAEELIAIAQEVNDESVKWNPFNKVVQSHKDGEIYISITQAEAYHKAELERITGLKRPILFRDDVLYVVKDALNFKYQESLKLLKQ